MASRSRMMAASAWVGYSTCMVLSAVDRGPGPHPIRWATLLGLAVLVILNAYLAGRDHAGSALPLPEKEKSER